MITVRSCYRRVDSTTGLIRFDKQYEKKNNLSLFCAFLLILLFLLNSFMFSLLHSFSDLFMLVIIKCIRSLQSDLIIRLSSIPSNPHTRSIKKRKDKYFYESPRNFRFHT